MNEKELTCLMAAIIMGGSEAAWGREGVTTLNGAQSINMAAEILEAYIEKCLKKDEKSKEVPF